MTARSNRTSMSIMNELHRLSEEKLQLRLGMYPIETLEARIAHKNAAIKVRNIENRQAGLWIEYRAVLAHERLEQRLKQRVSK